MSPLLGHPTFAPLQVAAREAVRGAVEEALGLPCGLLVEFTGLICWRPGAVIGWHHDANRCLAGLVRCGHSPSAAMVLILLSAHTRELCNSAVSQEQSHLTVQLAMQAGPLKFPNPPLQALPAAARLLRRLLPQHLWQRLPGRHVHVPA